ncbi:hypothetical protein BD770DRAFT_384608 [Pilaira anomala]|nr:hypothetical protein BD770DRAFT_384608 [Pilaira anomala]
MEDRLRCMFKIVCTFNIVITLSPLFCLVSYHINTSDTGIGYYLSSIVYPCFTCRMRVVKKQ